MIHPPLEACRQRKWETLSVAFAVVVVVAIPVAIALSALCARSAAEQWLSSYTPIVYLEPGTSGENADALAAELTEWPLVAQAMVRQPDEAYTALTERLGADVVTELGVTASMLPISIVLEPAVPLVGHIDLVSRVTGLEARADVDAVEVPSSDAMQVVTVAGVALGAAALLALFGLFAALVLIFGYLKRLRKADEDVDRVVALFGAYSGELRRPTLIRGLAVGSACGVLVSVSGGIALLAWQLWSVNLLGASLSAPIAAWSVVATPVLLIPVLGFVAALVASRVPVKIWRGANA